MRRTRLSNGFSRLGTAFAVVLFGLGAASRAMAAVDIATPTASASVIVGGEVGHPLTLDAASLARLPHVTVHGSDHGVSGSWSGVPLSAILSAGGVPLGEALRGRNMALYVRISAADGYRVVYAWPSWIRCFATSRSFLPTVTTARCSMRRRDLCA